MSSADLFEDGYPHGTVQGFDDGCRGGSCPAALEHGLSCKKAKMLAAGDFRYLRLVREGKTPAEIAAALELDGTAPTTPPKETRMPTPNDVAHVKNTAAAIVAAEIDTPATVEPITTDRWTAGLTQSLKRAVLGEIRSWCKANGFPGLADRGTIPQDALRAYDAAHPETRPGGANPADLEIPLASDTPTLADFGQDFGPRSDQLDETRQRIDRPQVGMRARPRYDDGVCVVREVVELPVLTGGGYVIRVTSLPDPRDEESWASVDWLDQVSELLPAVQFQFDHFGSDDILQDLDAWKNEGRIWRTPTDPNAKPERPEWADVTIPEDIERARSLAVRLEQELAHTEQRLAEAQARYLALHLTLTERSAELHQVSGSLALVLRKWAEATERLDQLADAEEHLDVAAQRIDNQEHTINTLLGEIHARDTIIDKLTTDQQRSPWWKRGSR